MGRAVVGVLTALGVAAVIAAGSAQASEGTKTQTNWQGQETYLQSNFPQPTGEREAADSWPASGNAAAEGQRVDFQGRQMPVRTNAPSAAEDDDTTTASAATDSEGAAGYTKAEKESASPSLSPFAIKQ